MHFIKYLVSIAVYKIFQRITVFSTLVVQKHTRRVRPAGRGGPRGRSGGLSGSAAVATGRAGGLPRSAVRTPWVRVAADHAKRGPCDGGTELLMLLNINFSDLVLSCPVRLAAASLASTDRKRRCVCGRNTR